jgi:uncharacterized protein (TIGR02466 family)
MITRHAFPIPIVTSVIDEAIIDNSLNLVNKFVESTGFTAPAAPGELLTTFYKDKNFLGNLNDRDLLNVINIKTREFFEILGYKKHNCFIEITSWLQYNQPNSYFVRHDHYGALTSGVVYLQTAPNCGDLMFHNPLEARRVTNTFFDRVKHEDNEYNFNHVTNTPVKGEMIMFESWLPHSVGKNLSNENRIAISFNIWADRDGKN